SYGVVRGVVLKYERESTPTIAICNVLHSPNFRMLGLDRRIVMCLHDFPKDRVCLSRYRPVISQHRSKREVDFRQPQISLCCCSALLFRFRHVMLSSLSGDVVMDMESPVRCEMCLQNVFDIVPQLLKASLPLLLLLVESDQSTAGSRKIVDQKYHSEFSSGVF